MLDDRVGQTPAAPLTAREVDVLAGVAVGEPNKAIAHRLGIGPATVKSYLSSAMVKLGASSRGSAVQLAREANALP
ncbi:helix-turn-helix transcriptional regulator [Geodermatophilaceae bacterium NBWT11]|nr:helix-turn-helix transcriptional regulator [Geodermatophilaceae bacterium NBWT11]